MMIVKKYAATLLAVVFISSACSSGNVSNSNGSNSNAAVSSNTNAAVVETKSKDTSPVTVKISDLFAEARSTSASSMMQKYTGRQMTVTDGVLYEFEVDGVKVGDGQNPSFGKESTEPQYFVTCSGKFSDDDDPNIALRTETRRLQGKAPVTTVKGTFNEYGEYNNKHWVILKECSMTKS